MALRWNAILAVCGLNAALALAYYVAARLGLATAIGPGQVTAVWPPSGLALAALMVWRARALPGLALGSFLLNWLGYLGPVLSGRPGGETDALWGAAWLSSGSMLQAVVAAAWLHGVPRALSTDPTRQTLKFAVVVALCCCIAPTIGNAGLVTLGVVATNDWAHGWLTWWVGDCAGMLVVTPPLLLWLHHAIRRDPISSLAFPILCMGLGLTLVTSFVVGHLEREAQIGRFRAGAKTLALMVQSRAELAQRDLETLQALHYKVDIDEAEFHALAGPLLERSAWHVHFAWLPQVPASKRSSYEQDVARQDGHASAWGLREIDAQEQLVPAAVREVYFPVRWTAPISGMDAPMGVDEGADLLRRDAVQKARQGDGVAVSWPIASMSRASTDRPVIALYAPVWNGNLPRPDQRTLRGLVSTTLDLGVLLGAVDEIADLRESRLLLHDPQAQQVAGVYWQAGQMEPWSRRAEPQRLTELTSGLHQVTPVQIADHTWQLAIQPLWGRAMWRVSWLQAGVFFSGLAFTTLLTGFMVVRRRRELELHHSRQLLEAEVVERTRELAQANQGLREASARADAANQAKSLFLANMSHEIRTPLNAVLGYAQLLREDALPGTPMQTRVQTILDAGQRLLRLINDVLDLSKIEAGSLELKRDVFDVRQEIDAAVSLLLARAQNKGLRLDADVALPAGEFVLGDRGKFGQIVINLLGNAIKFTDTGEVALRAWREGSFVRVNVTDTGPGISADERTRLFNPFTQGRAGQDKGGTGLGLTVARHIAQAMGGDLVIESPAYPATDQASSGLGTRVSLSVRLAVPGAGMGAAPDTAPSQVPDATGQLARLDPATPCCALVVDDDADSRDVLVQALRRMGCDVAVATDGEAGWQRCLRGGLDIVFTDIRMPVLDGVQMLARLKAEPRTAGLPVVAVSASSLAHERSHYIAQGFRDFVGKPFAFAQIAQMLERHASVRWRPTPGGPAMDTADQPDAPPDRDTALALLRLAAAAGAGDATRVRRCVTALEAGSALGTPSGRRLLQAVRGYDFETVEQIARAWAAQREGPQTVPAPEPGGIA